MINKIFCNYQYYKLKSKEKYNIVDYINDIKKLCDTNKNYVIIKNKIIDTLKSFNEFKLLKELSNEQYFNNNKGLISIFSTYDNFWNQLLLKINYNNIIFTNNSFIMNLSTNENKYIINKLSDNIIDFLYINQSVILPNENDFNNNF